MIGLCQSAIECRHLGRGKKSRTDDVMHFFPPGYVWVSPRRCIAHRSTGQEFDRSILTTLQFIDSLILPANGEPWASANSRSFPSWTVFSSPIYRWRVYATRSSRRPTSWWVQTRRRGTILSCTSWRSSSRKRRMCKLTYISVFRKREFEPLGPDCPEPSLPLLPLHTCCTPASSKCLQWVSISEKTQISHFWEEYLSPFEVIKFIWVNF